MFVGAATRGYLSNFVTSAPSTFMSYFRGGGSGSKGGGLAD